MGGVSDGNLVGILEKKYPVTLAAHECGVGPSAADMEPILSGVARARHLPRGLCLGRAAFTEGERCTGGFTGCGAFVLVGLRGASTIGLAAIEFAF
jgi:hypothetical protein